ncbi:MAG: arylsulfatase [Verrucomicrobiota bacterium]
MNPTSVLRRALALVLGLGLAATVAHAASASSRPNVLIFLADDQGWGDLSINGNTNLSTPNIDSIGKKGAVFDRFFVCSVCAPTRAEFLTGRYHSRGGVSGVSTGRERLNPDERTVAHLFKGAGYATGAFGKWHNGSQWPYHPNARGFDEYYGFTSGHWGEYFDPPLEHNGKPVRAKGFIADDLTNHALEFIEKNREKPFFCYVPYNTPHSPWAVPDEYWQRFKNNKLGMLGTDAEEIEETRCALAMVENLDWNVGRVLKRLDELKLSENTIVLYFSDNGPNGWRWNGGMKGRKGSTDEGGLRSPLMARWPAKIKPGTVVREVTGAIDLLPTLTAWAGIPVTGGKPLDGKDLSPIVLKGAKDWPDRMLFSHQNGAVSARSQRYRLDAAGELYDMVSDPGQKKAVTAENKAVATTMSTAVAAWRKDVLGVVAAEPTGETNKKGKAKKSGLAPDTRPYPVGYAEFPMTPLPARDGNPQGGVQRSSGAPNSSYFVNWKTKDDAMTWDVEINTTGSYDVVIYYTCVEKDAGSTIELSLNGAKLAGKVTPGWNPSLYTNQDTIKRPAGESQMKEFRPLTLGTIQLTKGRGPLTLRALEIPGASVMDVRAVILTLKK